jgi:plasmid maintenance system antidote protein VapI
MNRKSLRFAVPPGQHLIDELEARGSSFSDLKRSVPQLTTEADLVGGVTVVTPELSVAIGNALEMPSQIWLDLERNYREAIERGTSLLSDESLEAAQAKAASGKLLLRLPAGLHRRAADAAKTEGVSLNQLLLSYIAEGIGRTEGKRPVT